MKNKFKGWQSVFGFTFRQSTNGVGFKLVTALITFLILGIFILFNILVAKPDEKDAVPKQETSIHTVFILDMSGLPPTDFKNMVPIIDDQFQYVEYVTAENTSREDVILTAGKKSSQAIAVIITKNDTGYLLEAAVPADSTVSSDDASNLLRPMHSAFTSNKLLQAGLSVEQLTSALKPIETSFSEVGENYNEIAFAIKMIAPMLFGLMLYIMLLLYGQTISKSVSTEKTSKLMETLLTSIHPYALITGKVAAITFMALLQFVTWILAGGIGLYVGNAIAKVIYPEYENAAITIINFLKDNIGETAMTAPAVILAVLTFCVGFLFYTVIAGLAGCMVSKPEDVAYTQAIFQFPVIISWLVCYLAPVFGNETVLTVIRYIPFTAPFSVPSGLITGTIGLLEGLIALLIMLVFSVFVIIFSGRLYKGLILYTGQKFSFKMIGNVIKAKE